jgi:hypothetical protein
MAEPCQERRGSAVSVALTTADPLPLAAYYAPGVPPSPAPPRLPSTPAPPPDHALDAQTLREEGLRDATLERVDLSNLRVIGVLLERVELRGCRLTGLQLAESTIRDVVLSGCHLDLCAFRVCRFERVVFRDCRMAEADFVEAQLSSVVLEQCDMRGADFSHATFRRSELHGCRLEGAVALERLRGTAMPWPDVVGLAGELAQAIGIGILDPEDETR